jgi:uncharacterized repeat protein (TIGR01451 family)
MRSRALTSEDATETNRAPRGPKGRRGVKRLAVAAALLIAAVTALVAVGGASAMLDQFGAGHRAASHTTRHLAAVTPIPSNLQISQWQTKSGGSWTTGELGKNNAAYAEGDVIPFQLDADSLGAGDYSFSVCRDFINGDTYGYLKLAPFNTTLTPTGVTAPNTSGPFSATSEITITSVADTTSQGACGAGQVETAMTFTTTGGGFIYWGGYLAAPLDPIPGSTGTVPYQHSAGFYSGASLHMGMLGASKDLPIQPSSIQRQAAITVTKIVANGPATANDFCFTINPDPNNEGALCPTTGAASGSVVFPGLLNGSYSITETSAPGYSFTSGSGTNCTFSGSTATATVAIGAPPTDASCTFTNTFSKSTPTIETTLHNAAGDAPVANGTALALNSSLYDTAAVTATGSLPGTLSYQFFANGTCTAPTAGGDTGIAVGTKSSNQGPLAAGSYSFRAMYVAGNDPNHNDSAWSTCEPFSISKGTPTVETTLKNAADDGTVELNSTLDIGSSVYDTAAVTATDQLPLTGTVSYQFFTNSSCDGEVASESVSVGTESGTHGPLATGSYSFQAMYVAGNDPNHNSSAWSACEPFSIGKGTPTVETTLKNAADDETVDNGSTLDINSSLYDTAAVTATDGLDLTGTVSYQFFTNSSCDGEVASETGVALDGQSSTQGPLAAGDYSFRAMYVAGNDPNHNSSDWSACEPFSVGKAKPALTTTPSAGGTIGTSVHDTAVLSDSVEASGTIAFALYGVNDTTCTGSPLFTGSADVDGNGSVDSASYTPADAGTYRWVATYSGDANNEAAASNCGDELVTITSPPVVPPVTPPPPPPPVIDLAITKTGSPNPATLGKNVTWTMVVTNNGPNNATGVIVADPVPAGTTYVSSSATQGTCTGGVVVTCNLGSIAKGASVTVTLVTTTTTTGTITNTTTVVGNEHDSNTTNNTATATVTVKGAFVPPVTYCTAVAVTPKSLSAGRANKLTLKVAQHGKSAAGVRIRIKGASVNVITKPSNAKGIVKQTVKPTKAGIVTFTPVSVKSCKNVRVGILGVFTPPVTG